MIAFQINLGGALDLGKVHANRIYSLALIRLTTQPQTSQQTVRTNLKVLYNRVQRSNLKLRFHNQCERAHEQNFIK